MFMVINDTPLYSKHIQLTFSFIKSTQKKVIGNLWENYIQPNNVIFMEQMRQSKNTQYGKLLKNLTKNILKLKSEIFKTFFSSNLNVNLIDEPMKVITFIVPCNKL
jgi:effector-binding domain-containing protein